MASAVVAGRSIAGRPGRKLPAQGVVEGVQHDVVGQIRYGHLVDRRHDVILRDHDHRGLGVQGNRAEVRPVDRQPHETCVGAAAPQQVGCFGGGHRDESQWDIGQPLVPDAHPLGRRHAWDVCEPEREGCIGACHPARLPVVVGGIAHARYS